MVALVCGERVEPNEGKVLRGKGMVEGARNYQGGKGKARVWKWDIKKDNAIRHENTERQKGKLK